MNTVNILLHYCFPFGKKCHKELDKYMLNEKAATFIKLCAWKRTFNLQKRREEKDRVCMERLVYCISITMTERHRLQCLKLTIDEKELVFVKGNANILISDSPADSSI